MDDKRLVYKPREVAELFGVHPETVRNWIRRGWIPVQRIANRYYIPSVAVDMLLEIGIKPKRGGKLWRIE